MSNNESLLMQRVLAPGLPGKPKRSSTGEQLVALNDAEHKDLQNSLKGIVQVFLQAVEPNFSEPWTKSLPESSSGSGFVIDLKLRLIITNAHCVDYHRTILLRKHGDHTQYEARLLAISHQVDLAILTVEDDKFWLNADAVTFGDIVRMQQVVDIVGYPIGGDTVSISRGVVSRIDWIPYAQSGGEGQICVQVDAAINPGNSGGPALCNGKVVGVAFQGMSSEEAANVGYIIPVTIMKRVLADFKASATKMGIKILGYAAPSDLSSGSFDDLIAGVEDVNLTEADSNQVMKWPPAKRANGPLVKLQSFARFAVKYQTAENPFFRKFVKLPDDLDGVVIRSVLKLSNLHKVFEPNDVLIAIDGKSVGNEGKIYNEIYSTTMDLQYAISGKLVGEMIDYTICRNGQIIEIKSHAENPSRRVPLICKDPSVSYVMFCGLVFSPLSADSEITEEPIANLLIAKEAETLLLSKGRQYRKKGQQCVILTSLLPHRLTLGYAGIGQFTPILKVNDKLIDRVHDIAHAIATAKGELITFTFCDENMIVLPLKEGLRATWWVSSFSLCD
jgi:S1-C subfamily serine protease